MRETLFSGMFDENGLVIFVLNHSSDPSFCHDRKNDRSVPESIRGAFEGDSSPAKGNQLTPPELLKK